MPRIALSVVALVLAVLPACQSVKDSLENIRPPEVTLPQASPPEVSMPEMAPESTAKGIGSPGLPGPGAVILTPAGSAGQAPPPLVAPVRLQIGPQPFVVESCSLKPGDRVRLLIRAPGAEEATHLREYSWTGGLSTVGEVPAEWAGDPGEYEAELWVNGVLRDQKPFVVD